MSGDRELNLPRRHGEEQEWFCIPRQERSRSLAFAPKHPAETNAKLPARLGMGFRRGIGVKSELRGENTASITQPLVVFSNPHRKRRTLCRPSHLLEPCCQGNYFCKSHKKGRFHQNTLSASQPDETTIRRRI
jgi:hypothetical protein